MPYVYLDATYIKAGLKAAIARTFAGAGWQCCKVHLMRNLLGAVPSASKEMVAATVRTIFAQPDTTATHTQLADVVTILEPKFAKAAGLLADAEADVCAYAAFPRAHWPKIASTNPIELISKEIKRRSNVVGIFLDDASILRLVGAVLIEQHEDWAVTDRRYLSEESMNLIDQSNPEITTSETGELDAAPLLRSFPALRGRSRSMSAGNDDALRERYESVGQRPSVAVALDSVLGISWADSPQTIASDTAHPCRVAFTCDRTRRV